MTGDVGAVDPSLLSTGTLQEQLCTTDYVIIPNPSQGGNLLTSGSDRFCGLGLAATTSKPQKIKSKRKIQTITKLSYLFINFFQFR